VFYTKLQNRLLHPLLDADKPRAKIEIRRALTTFDHAVTDYIQQADSRPKPKLVTTLRLSTTKST
jgi:hypothetical protein